MCLARRGGFPHQRLSHIHTQSQCPHLPPTDGQTAGHVIHLGHLARPAIGFHHPAWDRFSDRLLGLEPLRRALNHGSGTIEAAADATNAADDTLEISDIGTAADGSHDDLGDPARVHEMVCEESILAN